MSQELKLISRGQEDYERARVGRVFNHRRPERYPEAVVEPTSEAELVRAVCYARDNAMKISIRSGGHSWAAWSVRDDTLLIDLGKYQYLTFDEDTQVAVASPSTTGEILNGYLTKRGYMFNGGHCPSVGIGGFLLQGGMGWNCRGWGWACESVLGVDVVLPDGRLVHCSKTENSDIFWAARGAGPGFFGLVTKFHLQCRRYPKGLLATTYIWPKEHYEAATRWLLETSETADPDIEIVSLAQHENQDEAATSDNIYLIHVLAFKDSVEESREILKPWHTNVPAGYVMSRCNYKTELMEEYELQKTANPEGHRYMADNGYLAGTNEEVMEAMRPSMTAVPNGKTFILHYRMGPMKQPLSDMALSLQSDHYYAIYCVWEKSEDDARFQGWVSRVMKDIEKHSIGQYLGDSDHQHRKSSFVSDHAWNRLQQIRKKYDPEARMSSYLGVETGIENGSPWLGDKSAQALYAVYGVKEPVGA